MLGCILVVYGRCHGDNHNFRCVRKLTPNCNTLLPMVRLPFKFNLQYYAFRYSHVNLLYDGSDRSFNLATVSFFFQLADVLQIGYLLIFLRRRRLPSNNAILPTNR